MPQRHLQVLVAAAKLRGGKHKQLGFRGQDQNVLAVDRVCYVITLDWEPEELPSKNKDELEIDRCSQGLQFGFRSPQSLKLD